MGLLLLSHLTWVRGLKHNRQHPRNYDSKSHLTWVRGLKHLMLLTVYFASVSHLTWVRGLKQNHKCTIIFISKSHLTWVRGLKLTIKEMKREKVVVAPYVGAWIETLVGSVWP